MKTNRLNRVLEMMAEQKMDQMIVSDSSAIFYLTGKWIHPGERLLALYLNVNGNHKLVINELFPVSEDLGVEKVWINDTQNGVKILADLMEKNKVTGVDKNWPARFLLQLMELDEESKYVNGSSIIDRVRMCKDKQEIEFMKESSRVTDIAVEKMIELVKEKYTEKKMGQILAQVYEENGASGFSFDPIVAYGANGADPHHGTDDSIVKEGDSIIIDIGCIKDSYCSDTTRTVFYKSVSDKAREVYETVKEANLKAISIVKPGVKFCDIDKAARDHIEAKGYGKYFTHRTGHSIGIEDHDFGDVSSINEDTVQPGMIFSIEPGIYLPGEFGVRIEDLILVTECGCEVLNKTSKDLRIIK